MMRWFALGVFCLSVLLGCGPTIAPLPPLTMPVPNSPQEYRVGRLVWKDNMVVTTNVQTFVEFRVRDAVKTSEERSVVRASVVGRTKQGHIHVRTEVDGVEFGNFVIDEHGQLDHGIPERPEDIAIYKAVADLDASSVVRELESRTLRLGEPLRARVPWMSMAAIFPPDWQAVIGQDFDMEYTYTGYVQLGAAVAAAVTAKAPNFLKSPLHGPAKDGSPDHWVHALNREEHAYYDPASGCLLASYSVTTVNGRLEDRPFRLRIIRRQTLDRARSRGL